MMQHPVRMSGKGVRLSFSVVVMKQTVVNWINGTDAVSSWQGNHDIPSTGGTGNDCQPSAWQRQGICFAFRLLTRGAVTFEDGRLRLCTGVQIHLAVCCKATLPILCMGHVRVRTDEHGIERPLLQATRCLTKQPGDVSHLEVSPRDVGHYRLGAHTLVDLRCAYAVVYLPSRGVKRLGMPWFCCATQMEANVTGLMVMLLCASAACC